MAAGVIAAPGTEFGPCEEECGHSDCRELRTDASFLCCYCGEAIGFDRRFYRLGTGELSHATCQERQMELEAKGIEIHQNGVVELDRDDPDATVCGICLRGWDDSISTGLTPAPAGRCPFEYEHDEED